MLNPVSVPRKSLNLGIIFDPLTYLSHMSFSHLEEINFTFFLSIYGDYTIQPSLKLGGAV
jgi:hypothetical protein